MNNEGDPLAFQCPVPDGANPVHAERISLVHGEGGRLTRQLIQQVIAPYFTNLEEKGWRNLTDLGDAVLLPSSGDCVSDSVQGDDSELSVTRHQTSPPSPTSPPGPPSAASPPPDSGKGHRLLTGELAMTTDSFVVSPIFFPGGDIGSLAVHGTVNDLAVAGARMEWLSLSLIIEEGLPMETLHKVLQSVAQAARQSHAQVVTGDTKVVPRGNVDQIYLNTTGIGRRLPISLTGLETIQPGDAIIISGPIGQHGMAILATRDGFEADPPLVSDSASLLDSVLALTRYQTPLRAMRDATRGGVAAVLQEWAEVTGLAFVLDEARVPISPGVRALGELLGLDPLHVACEGTMVVAVPAEHAQHACQVLRQCPGTSQATVAGEVRERRLAPVLVRRALGQEVPLEDPAGAPLPRIC
jgi:hydrogenase expression/formation protein HypE